MLFVGRWIGEVRFTTVSYTHLDVYKRQIKIDVTSEGITLSGSNGQISIEYFISVKDENAGLLVTTPGAILLEATFFINVVSSLPDVVLDVKEIEQKQIVLVSGKSEITLKGKDAEQYPRIQEISDVYKRQIWNSNFHIFETIFKEINDIFIFNHILLQIENTSVSYTHLGLN